MSIKSATAIARNEALRVTKQSLKEIASLKAKSDARNDTNAIVRQIILPALESAVEAELAQILAANSAQEIVTGIVIPWAQKEAKVLGG